MNKIDVNNYEAFLLDYFEGRLNQEQTHALKAFLMEHPQLGVDLNDADFISFPSLENDVVFEDKSSLKKNTVLVDDELAFEYVEGNLSPEAKAHFENELQKNPELAKALASYQKTILSSDLNIQFGLNSELYQFSGHAAEIFAYTEGSMNAEERKTFEEKLKSDAYLQTQVVAYNNTRLQADASLVFPNKADLKRQETKVIPLFNWRYAGGIAAGIAIVVGLYLFTKSDTINTQGLSKNDAKTKDSNSVKQKSIALPNSIQEEKNSLADNKDGYKNNSKEKSKSKSKSKKAIVRQLASMDSVTENYLTGTTRTKKQKGSIIRQLKNDSSAAENNLAGTNKGKDKKIKGSIIRQLAKDTTTNGLANTVKGKNKKIKGVIIKQFGKDTTATQLANTTPSVVPTNTNTLANVSTKEKTTRLSFIPEAYEIEDDSTAIKTAEIKKKGFWSRALKTAGQLNALGLKSINGNENEKSDVLSLSKMSVELKKSR
jgi:hypothetical protein